MNNLTGIEIPLECVREYVVEACEQERDDDCDDHDEYDVHDGCAWLRPHHVVELDTNVPEIGEE